MSADETGFIAALRALATDPAARGFEDDAAVLGDLVLTHDMIVEGVHFLPGDPPADIAWKLAAVNLSDLAAKGAVPLGMLLGYSLGSGAWNSAFIEGLRQAIDAFGTPLLGGDTVAVPHHAPRSFGLTAIGRAPAGGAPNRSGARAGDALFVTGTIGDAGLGLELARAGEDGTAPVRAYRRPVPLLAEGRALAPQVHAMMDVSDGLLIDAARMAAASGLAIAVDIDAIPLSADYRARRGVDRAARLSAATAGDDYQLLFAAPADAPLTVPATRIGICADGTGLSLRDAAGEIPLPERLGYLHS